MKRTIAIMVALAMLGIAGARDVSAQGIFVGGGATIPTGDYGDFANTGWMAYAGVISPVGTQGLSIGAEGYYGGNGYEATDGSSKLYGALALAGLTFGPADAAASPFVYGGVGFMSHSAEIGTTDVTESGVAVSGGAGVSFPFSPAVQGMILGSYLHGFIEDSATSLFGLSAAIQFLFGT